MLTGENARRRRLGPLSRLRHSYGWEHMADEPHFGGVLRDARVAAGVRVNDLARRMGVRPSTVCRIEACRNELLESTVARYAKALGLRVELRLEVVPQESP